MNTKALSLSIACTCILLITGCRQTSQQTSQTASVVDTATVTIQYAQGLKVTTADGYRLLEICDPQKQDKTYRFALPIPGAEKQSEEAPQGYTVVQTPVKSLICTTSLQLGGFIELKALDFIGGINSSRRLFDEDLKARLADGRIQQIGKEGEFDEELVMAIHPSAILISLSKRGGFGKLTNMGIPLLPYTGYQEVSPLAQAEWIKLVGMLTGKSAEANQTFEAIRQRYQAAQALISDSLQRPRVFYGKMHGDNWYAMGGNSFIAQILHDAGATYFLNDSPSDLREQSGGVNLDFETVYAQGQQCAYWVIQNKGLKAQSYENLVSEDARYADFKACQTHHVICCDVSLTPVNELSAMEPDIVLRDFISIFHPQLLPDYTPKYYAPIPTDSKQ